MEAQFVIKLENYQEELNDCKKQWIHLLNIFHIIMDAADGEKLNMLKVFLE